MGELVKLLTVDFSVPPSAGLCDIVEPNDPKDIPEDVPNDDPDDDCAIVRKMLKEDPKSLTYMKTKEGYWKDKNDKEYFCPDEDLVPVIECTVDTDCPEGQTCVNGECVPDPAPECTVDTDCPKGYVCLNGKCVKDDEIIDPPDDPGDDPDPDPDPDPDKPDPGECKMMMIVLRVRYVLMVSV